MAMVRAMTAESIAKALGGRKTGAAWIARCPVHDDRAPSLAIAETRDGKVLVHCHAGCCQQDVIAALRARGAWDPGQRWHIGFLRKSYHEPPPEADRVGMRRMEAALAIWRGSQSADGTPVETYLRSRGITIPVPGSIRFNSGLEHPSGGVWPAMVALVTRGGDGKSIGIHRTFLTIDGRGKAPVEPQKMMLGPCRGGALRLERPCDALMVGEGIETCLSAMQASGRPVWAALSTSGLRSLDLPLEVHDVTVLADGDDPGESAARHCALRWKRQGRRVRIARPPHGMDFNDLLMRRVRHIEESAR
jgi:putative DNA primase/helicase